MALWPFIECKKEAIRRGDVTKPTSFQPFVNVLEANIFYSLKSTFYLLLSVWFTGLQRYPLIMTIPFYIT